MSLLYSGVLPGLREIVVEYLNFLNMDTEGHLFKIFQKFLKKCFMVTGRCYSDHEQNNVTNNSK